MPLIWMRCTGICFNIPPRILSYEDAWWDWEFRNWPVAFLRLGMEVVLVALRKLHLLPDRDDRIFFGFDLERLPLPWDYYFFKDLTEHPAIAGAENALHVVHELQKGFRVMGLQDPRVLEINKKLTTEWAVYERWVRLGRVPLCWDTAHMDDIANELARTKGTDVEIVYSNFYRNLPHHSVKLVHFHPRLRVAMNLCSLGVRGVTRVLSNGMNVPDKVLPETWQFLVQCADMVTESRVLDPDAPIVLEVLPLWLSAGDATKKLTTLREIMDLIFNHWYVQ